MRKATTEEAREHEFRRLYLAARELMRGINAGETDMCAPGWVLSDISIALERIEWDAKRWGAEPAKGGG